MLTHTRGSFSTKHPRGLTVVDPQSSRPERLVLPSQSNRSRTALPLCLTSLRRVIFVLSYVHRRHFESQLQIRLVWIIRSMVSVWFGLGSRTTHLRMYVMYPLLPLLHVCFFLCPGAATMSSKVVKKTKAQKRREKWDKRLDNNNVSLPAMECYTNATYKHLVPVWAAARRGLPKRFGGSSNAR